MTNSWQQWQGRTVDGKFALGTYLGGSDHSAVFRTRIAEVSADRGLADKGSAGGHPLRNAGKEEAAEKDGAAEKTDAAIKLVLADGAEAESPLRRWQAASRLSHPNLIRILAAGRANVDGRELVYEVEEFAEENLAQILPDRALAADEARGMLAPVLAALAYVHSNGLVHGAIHPSNILATGDQVKLSSDSLRPAGEVPRTISLYDAPEVLTAGVSPASDVWSLGMTLVEVLTQHAPVWDPARMAPPEGGDDIPNPFGEIAQRCLQLDPANRCSLRDVANGLQSDPAKNQPESSPQARQQNQPKAKLASAAAAQSKPGQVESISASQNKSARGPYLLVLAAAIVITIFLIARPRPSSAPEETSAPLTSPPGSSSPQSSSPQTSIPQTAPPAPSSQPPTTQAAPAESPALSTAAQPTHQQKAAAADEIVERAMPQVSPSARRTISGKIKIRVRVTVDAAGNVTEAKLKEAGPSKYFAHTALEAARRWKFAPAPDATRRDWILLFAFTRAHTEMSATYAR
jgi:TonB family protein